MKRHRVIRLLDNMRQLELKSEDVYYKLRRLYPSKYPYTTLKSIKYSKERVLVECENNKVYTFPLKYLSFSYNKLKYYVNLEIKKDEEYKKLQQFLKDSATRRIKELNNLYLNNF